MDFRPKSFECLVSPRPTWCSRDLRSSIPTDDVHTDDREDRRSDGSRVAFDRSPCRSDGNRRMIERCYTPEVKQQRCVEHCVEEDERGPSETMSTGMNTIESIASMDQRGSTEKENCLRLRLLLWVDRHRCEERPTNEWQVESDVLADEDAEWGKEVTISNASIDWNRSNSRRTVLYWDVSDQLEDNDAWVHENEAFLCYFLSLSFLVTDERFCCVHVFWSTQGFTSIALLRINQKNIEPRRMSRALRRFQNAFKRNRG